METSDLIDGLTRIFSKGVERERERERAFSEVLASSIIVRFSAKSGGGEKKNADRRHPQGG